MVTLFKLTYLCLNVSSVEGDNFLVWFAITDNYTKLLKIFSLVVLNTNYLYFTILQAAVNSILNDGQIFLMPLNTSKRA